MGVEVEAIETKGTDNLFNRIMDEKSVSLRKRESLRCRKITEHQMVRTKKKHLHKHHNQNT
jgi:hypothetical protein